MMEQSWSFVPVDAISFEVELKVGHQPFLPQLLPHHSCCYLLFIHEPSHTVFPLVDYNPNFYSVGDGWPSSSAVSVLPDGSCFGEVGDEEGTEM